MTEGGQPGVAEQTEIGSYFVATYPPYRGGLGNVAHAYVEGLRGYKRNKLELDARTRDDVYQWWQVAFDAFGYPRDYAF